LRLKIGVAANAYGNVEAGSPLSKKMMYAIKGVCPDVTWEWLQDGDDRFLTVEMRQRLRDAEAEIAAASRAESS
jgi:hypothetical protein